MKAAFIIFDGMTALDLIGVYDPLTRLKSMHFMPRFSWKFCAVTPVVFDDRGLQFSPDSVGESLSGYDLMVVPGGSGTRALRYDKAFIDWLVTARSVQLKTSVCTGALLLGAAGFLTGKTVTTHPGAVDELRPYCGSVSNRRVVDEGEIVTAGGVSSSVDLGLHLVERLAGFEVREKVARQMDYPYGQPHSPFMARQ